jgi:O-antigen/teichoic acid export membrane protein
MITYPYLARVILPQGLGLVSYIESICRYAILISALGIPLYGVREISKIKHNHLKLSSLFSDLIVLNTLISISVIIFYAIILINIEIPKEYFKYYLIGGLFIFSNVFLIEWFFQGLEDFRFIAVRNLIIRGITVVIIFIFVKFKTDTYLYFCILTFSTIVNAIVNMYYVFSTLKIKLRISLDSLSQHIKPLIYIFGSIAFITVYTLMDTIMLGSYSNNYFVGIYTMGIKLAKLPIAFIGALGVVLIPKLSKHHLHGNFKEFNILIEKSINFVLTFSVPLIFFFLSLSDEIILLFAGLEFHDSSIIVKILSILSLLIGLSNVFGLQILTPMSKDKYFTYSVALGTITSVSLNIILLPKFNAVGAAFSSVIAELVVLISTIYFSSKFLKIQVNFKFILLTVIYSIPYFFFSKILYFIIINPLYILMCSCILSGIYFVFSQIFLVKNELFQFDELYNKVYSYYKRSN